LLNYFQIINIIHFIDSSDECDDSGDEWQPYNNKNNAIDSDSDGVIGTCNDENIFGVINVTENTENKKTGEQNIIKSVINYIIDEICNQSKDTLLEALDETVNSQSKKLVRRVRGDASKWKKNVISKEKKKLKKPKAIDCSHCKFKCSINFDESYRNEVCNKFWALDYNRQKDFILANVNIKSVKRHVPITNIRKAKENSKVYSFNNNTEHNIQVCKQFFLKTLCISHGPVDKAFEGLGTDTGLFMDHDKRGKAPLVNKSSDEIIANINSHIEKFPTVESHYCRSTSKRQYLDPNLSISKMYELYVKECNETGQKQVSLSLYKKIFCENHNLSFFKPKKDQCLTCEKYNKSAKPQSKYMVINYENHIRRRDESFAAKKLDKERATSDQSFCSATFDLQSVLQIPSSEVSAMYYSRKLCVYNLTLYEAAAPNNAFCFLWTEVNGQKGSSEIGSALLKWIYQLPERIKEISLYSDTCSGQNRNQYVAALFLFVVIHTNIEVLHHNFMESGHSYMEVDSMHSAIESAKKNVPVYTMHDWLNICRLARSQRNNKKCSGYSVHELLYTDIYDLKSLASILIKNRTIDNYGDQVSWLKIKVMKYEKNKKGIIQFKYNYSDNEYRSIHVGGKGRPSKLPENLKMLYDKQLKISENKKKDLMKLCKSEAIPKDFHNWYQNIPFSSKKKDTI